MFAKYQTQSWCCSGAFLHVWFVNTSLNHGNACCSGQLCGNGDGDGFPLLKCQRSALKLPGAPPPVSLQDTTASATAVLQPCTGSHKGRVTPSEWGLTEGFSLVYFSGGSFVEVFVLTCKVTHHLFRVENEKKRKCFQTGRLTGSEWLIGSTGLHGCYLAVYSSCCLLPDGLWALWQSSFGCFTYVYWCGSPEYLCLIENSFISK